jgi:hypothetical protein
MVFHGTRTHMSVKYFQQALDACPCARLDAGFTCWQNRNVGRARVSAKTPGTAATSSELISAVSWNEVSVITHGALGSVPGRCCQIYKRTSLLPRQASKACLSAEVQGLVSSHHSIYLC